MVRDAKVVDALLATFKNDWASTGYEEAREAAKKDADAPQPEKTAKATRALVKEMPPVRTTLKKAIKQAITRAGREAKAHGELKGTVKAAVKTAVKEAVKEIVQEVQHR